MIVFVLLLDTNKHLPTYKCTTLYECLLVGKPRVKESMYVEPERFDRIEHDRIPQVKLYLTNAWPRP